ncbi:MAG: hypothetical protein R3E79_48270 [Caldilineaceae bacterium]
MTVALAIGQSTGMPEDLWQAVLAVVTPPPVSDFLSVGLTLSRQKPPLPEPIGV